MKAFVSRHRLFLFFALAYLLSWYPWILALLQGRTSGPNPLGPLVAAVIVTGIVDGRTGLAELFHRIVRWRIGLKWYLAAFGLPVLLCAMAAAFTSLTNDAIHFPPIGKLRELPDRFLFILLFIGLGEEPGWRGFALPQLQTSRGPLRASLILAPLWAIWNLPLLGNEFPWPIVPAFLFSVLGGTFLLTWLFNGTKGSVLAAMVCHASINTVGAGLVFPLFAGRSLLLLWWIYAAVCVGIGFVLLKRQRGTQKPIAAAGDKLPAVRAVLS